jgi:hypothetical protein
LVWNSGHTERESADAEQALNDDRASAEQSLGTRSDLDESKYTNLVVLELEQGL